MLPTLTVNPEPVHQCTVSVPQLTEYIERLISEISDDALDTPVVASTLPGTRDRRLVIGAVVANALPQVWPCTSDEARDLYDQFVTRQRALRIRLTQPIVVPDVVYSKVN